MPSPLSSTLYFPALTCEPVVMLVIFLFVFFMKESHFKGHDLILTKSEIQNYLAGLKQQLSKQPTDNE